MKEIDDLGYLEIAGSPLARGEFYGQVKKQEIDKYFDYFYCFLAKRGFDKKRALQEARKHIPYIEDFSETAALEMQGLANGAQRPYEEFVLLSMHEELGGFTPHCTAFAANGNLTESGDVLLGQTWDIAEDQCRNASPFLLKSAPQGENAGFLAYTYAGIIAGAGMNSYGVAMSWNSVPRLEIKVGVPTYIIIAEILRQKTLGDAMSVVVRAKRAGCFGFMLCDSEEIYNVEATPASVDIDSSPYYLAHANHYLNSDFARRSEAIPQEANRKVCSQMRYYRMERLLAENVEGLTLAKSLDFMRDHGNTPYSICRHSGAKDGVVTCAAWVMIPRKKEFWISAGPACRKDFKCYILDDKKEPLLKRGEKVDSILD